MIPNKRIVVEIRAPHNGAVQDINIYHPHTEIVEKIMRDIRGRASFVNETKAEIDDFELIPDRDSLGIAIRVDGYEGSYGLGNAIAEVTYGGLAYNLFQNLYALDNSLEGRLSLLPIIGLPRELIQELKDKGMGPASDYFLPANARKSLMIVCDNLQLNLVTKKSTVYEAPTQLEVPDVAVISTYPLEMNEEELDRIKRYKDQKPDLRVYFNPGGTQVRIGIVGFREVMPIVNVVTMKLDEAGKFLGIENKFGSRVDFARRCLRRFLEEGTKVVVLNDSEKGSYIGYGDSIYHTLPFPKQPIERIVEREVGSIVQNFSGCGDGIFSGILYGSEVYNDMSPQERLTFASSLARFISLIPNSNLYNVDHRLIKDTFHESRGYKHMVRNIGK